MEDLSVVYYTSNYLDDKNPYFLENTRKQLVKAIHIDNTDAMFPLIVVSQKPVDYFKGIVPSYTNIVVGDIGRSHLNIYRQILEGCKAAKTTWVAMAEDDILYSQSHFHFWYFTKKEFIDGPYFLYDMNKVSIFTWERQKMFSVRSKRMVVNHLIAKREMLISALEERFARLEELRKTWPEGRILKYWGDPGRYEGNLGVTIRETYQYYCWVPSIVFSHEYAYGYEFNQGNKKKQGDLRIVELVDWGRAEDILKLYKP